MPQHERDHRCGEPVTAKLAHELKAERRCQGEADETDQEPYLERRARSCGRLRSWDVGLGIFGCFGQSFPSLSDESLEIDLARGVRGEHRECIEGARQRAGIVVGKAEDHKSMFGHCFWHSR